MLYLKSASQNPYYNLALEEYLFHTLGAEEPCFMLWQNSNTIVIGKNQNTIEEINKKYVDEHDILVARRLSGGGAVYHDTGNLNYTIIVSQKNIADFNFKVFVRPVVRTLENFQIHAEFNGRNDVTINGKKFSGNSQYAKKGRLLHHGCIMLDSNLETAQNALKVRKVKIQSKGAKSVISRITTINENAARKISMEEFEEAFVREISRENVLKPYELTAEDEAAIRKLCKEKYSTWEWNWGFFGDYELKREKKYPAGVVSVYMNVKNSRIKEIRLFGDFFGKGEIKELEASMSGLALDEKLTGELEKKNISYYMNGITAENLCELLLY